MENVAVKTRTVQRIASAERTLEGEGVPIRRAFPTRVLADIDPFLLLDHLGPVDLGPGEAKGFPSHPHRGFETVSYVLDGQLEHRDSYGNHGRLGPGDLQWMTAGSGLVHSEMPSAEIARNGGRLQMFQLWVNLPQRDKMTPPRYQELTGGRIPTVERAGATARVIAGEALGVRGLIETRIPIVYLHVTLAPGAKLDQSVPRSRNAFVYVMKGEVEVADGALAKEGQFAIFEHDADDIVVTNASASPADFLLIAGEPLNEPVARYGPFVMNTRQELVQAYEDFQNGRMGRLSA